MIDPILDDLEREAYVQWLNPRWAAWKTEGAKEITPREAFLAGWNAAMDEVSRAMQEAALAGPNSLQ